MRCRRRALTDYETMPKRSRAAPWQVAADVCVFTNDRVTLLRFVEA
jgi:ATP-dependent protease HslVU (ClpYQ) peptidase subunit